MTKQVTKIKIIQDLQVQLTEKLMLLELDNHDSLEPEKNIRARLAHCEKILAELKNEDTATAVTGV